MSRAPWLVSKPLVLHRCPHTICRVPGPTFSEGDKLKPLAPQPPGKMSDCECEFMRASPETLTPSEGTKNMEFLGLPG